MPSSITRPFAQELRDDVRRIDAERVAIAIRWLRSTVVSVSSWMHDARRIADSTSSALARRTRGP